MLSYIIISLFFTICLFMCTFMCYKHRGTANIAISQCNTGLNNKKLTGMIKIILVGKINRIERMKIRYAKFLIFIWVVILIGWAIVTKIHIF